MNLLYSFIISKILVYIFNFFLTNPWNSIEKGCHTNGDHSPIFPNRQTAGESASLPQYLVATSADSVPSSYLVRITIAPIGTTFGNLQWRRYWNNFTFEYSSNNNIFSFVAMSADSIPICICIWYVVEPNYGFYTTGRESADGGLYWRRFLRAVLNASKEFACTTLFGRWFQWITVSTKKECWYCCFL